MVPDHCAGAGRGIWPPPEPYHADRSVCRIHLDSLWRIHAVAVPEYSDILVVRFLSSYAIIAAFAIAMDNSRFDSLSKYQDLSSRVDEITHQDVLTQLP